MRSSVRFAVLIVFLVAIIGSAIGEQLAVVVLDGKTGHALRHKKVCVSFNPDPNGNGVDKPNVCRRTGSNGRFSLEVPTPLPPVLHVAVLTNDLLPCFAVPHRVTVSEVLQQGSMLPNTCGGAGRAEIAPGVLVIFAHQMSRVEVLKSMGKEL